MSSWLGLWVLSLAQSSAPGSFHGWKTDCEYRFVWSQDRQKVGETTLRWSLMGENRETPAVRWKIDCRRSYDRLGISQRSSSMTLCDAAGFVIQYEDRTDVTANVGKKAKQVTNIGLTGEKAHVTYTQEGKTQPRIEAVLPAGTRLTASQAIEHWILFLATWSREPETRDQDLYYPDFGRVLRVTFRRGSEEKVRIGSGEIVTVPHAFKAARESLEGTVWLDKNSRLVQIEFINALKPELTLRVTLADETPGAKDK